MKTCLYCGELAEGLDHTVPLARTARHGVRIRTRKPGEINNGNARVPACQECNSLLGSQVFISIEARAAFLARKLKNRYRNLLLAPDWTEEELAEIGVSLRERIAAKTALSNTIKRRISVCLRVAG